MTYRLKNTKGVSGARGLRFKTRKDAIAVARKIWKNPSQHISKAEKKPKKPRKDGIYAIEW